jgi:DnaJ-class molecular chaperone
MATKLTDGEREILDDLNRDAEPGPCPTCKGRGVIRTAAEAGPNRAAYALCPDCGADAGDDPAELGDAPGRDARTPTDDACPTCGGDSIACPDCRPIDPPKPTGPDPESVAYWRGYSAARDDFEAERRDLEMTIAQLECRIADYRAELAHRD